MKRNSIVLGVAGAGLLVASSVSLASAGEGFGDKSGRFGRGGFGGRHQFLQNLTEEQRSQLQTLKEENKDENKAAIAEFLGLTIEEFNALLEDGNSLSDIVEQQGKTLSELIDLQKSFREENKLNLQELGIEFPEKPEGDEGTREFRRGFGGEQQSSDNDDNDDKPNFWQRIFRRWFGR